MLFGPEFRKPEEGYFLTCVDPGGDTGLALLHVKPTEFELIEYATVKYRPEMRDCDAMPTAHLIAWVLEHPGEHRLVYEDFHLRNNAADKDTTALRVIGSMEQVIYDRDLYAFVHAQEPVEAKHMVSDEVLEKLELHLSHMHSARHVRDALRHGVTHLTRARYLPVCRTAYPRGGGVTSHPGLRP